MCQVRASVWLKIFQQICQGKAGVYVVHNKKENSNFQKNHTESQEVGANGGGNVASLLEVIVDQREESTVISWVARSVVAVSIKILLMYYSLVSQCNQFEKFASRQRIDKINSTKAVSNCAVMCLGWRVLGVDIQCVWRMGGKM